MDQGENEGLSIAEIAHRERALEQQIDAAVRSGLEDTDRPAEARVDSVVAELRELGVEPHVDNIKEMLDAQSSEG